MKGFSMGFENKKPNVNNIIAYFILVSTSAMPQTYDI